MERGKLSCRGSVSVNNAQGASYLDSGDLLGVDETWVEVVGVSGKLQEGGVLVVLMYLLSAHLHPFPYWFLYSPPPLPSYKSKSAVLVIGRAGVAVITRLTSVALLSNLMISG